jgi:hypothetical protein
MCDTQGMNTPHNGGGHMSWSFQIDNRYHTQDTSYYCGAACAMMILNEIGVAYADLDQQDLYNSNHSHNVNSGWYTDPYGLCYTLNDRHPTSFSNFFVVYKRLTEADGTRDVVYTLHHYKVSPAILVYNCAHWNVVCGVQTDVEPGSGPYTVEGFWLNNPVWYNSPPPPPHDDTDACGSGGTHGLAKEFVTYTTWQTDRFNGCNFDNPSGASQWISVCDPDGRTIALPNRRPKRYLANGRSLIAAPQVREFVETGLNEYQLAESEFAAATLRAGQIGDPVLVLRLDRPDDYYYLVPWEVDRQPAAFVELDARFGFFKSLQLLSSPSREGAISGESSARLRARMARRLDGFKFELPNEGGKFTLYPGTYCISPTLVWKPCRESWSPHLPFHQITIGERMLYVRIDGQVFTQLTSGRGV